jgi:hypothetical protein
MREQIAEAPATGFLAHDLFWRVVWASGLAGTAYLLAPALSGKTMLILWLIVMA